MEIEENWDKTRHGTTSVTRKKDQTKDGFYISVFTVCVSSLIRRLAKNVDSSEVGTFPQIKWGLRQKRL